MIKILILGGSVRPGNFNAQPAAWIHGKALSRDDMEVELVNLAELNLPFLDEPKTPSKGEYTKDHTKAWAARVGGADGFVFVTPEYNHSYSPALKNAIDYLFAEWHHKPVAFLSYGSLAGGARAVEHLRGVAGEVKLYDLREQILLPNYWDDLDENGDYRFNERHEAAADDILGKLAFWARELKASRSRIPA